MLVVEGLYFFALLPTGAEKSGTFVMRIYVPVKMNADPTWPGVSLRTPDNPRHDLNIPNKLRPRNR